jgi:hypothetical protein
MTLASPFLALRLVYSVLGAFAPPTLIGHPPENNSLSKFNSITGSWVPQFFMSLAPEFIYICIFCATAFLLARTPATDGNQYGDRIQLERRGESEAKVSEKNYYAA